MEFTLGLCLLYAGLTEAEWRPVRTEIAAAKLPPRAVLADHTRLNERLRVELTAHVESRRPLLNVEPALRDVQDRQYFLTYALAAYDARDPWECLYWLHQVRDCVGDGAFYNGPWPNPVPVDALPWYDGPRHREGGR